MWTYKNNYYAVLIIVFPTHKKDTKAILKIEENVGMVEKKLSNKSSSDGKLI